MPRRTFSTEQITEMLARWHRGDSTSTVAAAIGVDRKTVKKYADCARAAGVRPGGPAMSSLDWSELIARSHPMIAQPRLRRVSWLEFDDHRDFIRGRRAAGEPQERIWRRLYAEKGVRASLASFKRWFSENAAEAAR